MADWLTNIITVDERQIENKHLLHNIYKYTFLSTFLRNIYIGNANLTSHGTV